MKKDFWDGSHTTARFPPSSFTLSPDDRVIFFGSCFSDELSSRYEELGLPCSASPFGIIYNPLTMAESFQSLIENKLKGEPFHQLGLWRHFAFHSSRCIKESPDRQAEADRHFTELVNRGHGEILNADCLILTLGTAWVYKHVKSEMIVNNCHRCDNREFVRLPYLRFLEKGRDNPLGEALEHLKTVNPGLRVIITLSPIRHLRDDVRENSYSKALLRCLCEEICRDRDWVEYFPAYEIVMDELRDYRWYAEDLTHLSRTAVNYILQRFFEWAGDEELLSSIAGREKKLKRKKHRPLS